MEASIQLIIGPMFSGKSTELLRRADRYRIQNRYVVLFKYEKDTRYSQDSIATHSGHMMQALPLKSANYLLEQYRNLIESADIICIDEVYFIENVEICEYIASALGKIVIAAGLNSDFRKQPFTEVLKLIPIAEDITKLSAVCSMCYKDASYSHRLHKAYQYELIGGMESYTSLCRHCFYIANHTY